MRRHRMTDGEAEALMRGTTPATRPELAPLATYLTEFRAAAFSVPPQPSAALRDRLTGASVPEISSETAPRGVVDVDSGRTTTAGRIKRMFAWFSGLGVAAKILLGVTAAVAAGGAGIGTAAGVNSIVSSVTGEQQDVEPTPTVEPTDAGEDPAEDATPEPGEFGSWVSDRAHELGEDGDGHAFGEETSEQAQQQGDDHAQNPEGTGQGEHGGSGSQDDGSDDEDEPESED